MFSAKIAEWPPVWERAIHSIYCMFLSWTFIIFSVCRFSFGFEVSLWDLNVFIPDPCLSIYFVYIFNHLLWLSYNIFELSILVNSVQLVKTYYF